MADQQYEKGKELEQQGYWERALAAYRRACGLDATSVLYLVARGRVCQAHGIEEEAAACYEAALRLRPDDTVALYNQAQLFAARGQLDEARANLNCIVSHGPAKESGGAVEVLGERAAPIFCKLGEIALRREEYRVAEIHFRKALSVLADAPDPAKPVSAPYPAKPHPAAEERYARAALDALPRFAEFERPIAPDGRIDPKVAVYAYAGAVALGMPDDDGVALPQAPGLGFDSLEEVAETLARPVRLMRRLGWEFDAVAALDAESQPIAIALGRALQAKAYGPAEPAAPQRGAACLGVTATGRDPGALRERVLALRERCGGLVTYAVGLVQPVWEYAPPPHVISMPVRLEYPWNRGEASAAEHAEAFGAELAERLEAVLERADDGTTAAQLGWYGRHSRLNAPFGAGDGRDAQGASGGRAIPSFGELASAPG